MLINRIRSRIQEGMTRNFADYRIFLALDEAWNVPFKQISPTLVQQLMDRDPNQESVYKAFQDWGLTHLISERTDPKTGKSTKSLSLPTFFNIFVPLVRAYVTIRWAKIMNDRRLTPFFKYEPIDQTTVLTAVCKALTDRVQIMSAQYGYFDVMKQAVLKMLHYSTCFEFVKCAWDYRDTWKEADEVDVMLGHKREDGEPASKGDPIKVTEREGLSYHHPHPTRTYYDLAHPPYQFNYDYGPEYAGYWRIARYREILYNPYFWNRNKIALGTFDLIADNRLFFTSVYAGCTMSMGVVKPQPKAPEGPVIAAELGVGTSTMDREREIANLYYGTEHGDQGVLITEHWERLIPVENGLGDYDCPVWFRFVVAGDGCTILYAEPVPYCPVTYYGYDADESRTRNASLSLEVLPFQDHFSNMLTQIILTCKQNLANLTFIDEDQLMTGDPTQRQGARETIDQIRNIGEGMYRFLNIFGFSSKRAIRMNVGTRGIPEVVQSWQFPRGNVAEMSNVLRTILEILERVLVMSSQEIAQAATHELRVDEVRNIAASTSSRLQHTATPVDIARDAKKRQIYCGLMAFGDEDFWVRLPSDIPLTQEQLAQVGFTAHKKHLTSKDDRFVEYRIKKKDLLTAVPIWALASTRDGEDRVDGVRVAQAMALFIQSLLSNPITAQALGPDQALEWANQISQMMGFPKDFKLRNMAPQATAEQQRAEAQEQLKQVLDLVLKTVDSQMTKDLKPLLDEVKRHQTEISILFKAMQLPQLDPTHDYLSQETNGAGGPEAGSRMAASEAGVVV